MNGYIGRENGGGRERRRNGWDKLASFPGPAGGNEARDKYTLDELLNCCISCYFYPIHETNYTDMPHQETDNT